MSVNVGDVLIDRNRYAKFVPSTSNANLDDFERWWAFDDSTGVYFYAVINRIVLEPLIIIDVSENGHMARVMYSDTEILFVAFL